MRGHWGFYKMKRYKVMARRNANERWTEWTVTDDINMAIENYNTIKGNGWDAMVSDEGVNELVQAVVGKFTEYIDELITKYTNKRDTHKDVYDAVFYATCNGKVAVLGEIKKFMGKVNYEN